MRHGMQAVRQAPVAGTRIAIGIRTNHCTAKLLARIQPHRPIVHIIRQIGRQNRKAGAQQHRPLGAPAQIDRKVLQPKLTHVLVRKILPPLFKQQHAHDGIGDVVIGRGIVHSSSGRFHPGWVPPPPRRKHRIAHIIPQRPFSSLACAAGADVLEAAVGSLL